MPHVTCVRHLRFCAPQPALEPRTSQHGLARAAAMQGGMSCHGPLCKKCGLTQSAQGRPHRGAALCSDMPASGAAPPRLRIPRAPTRCHPGLLQPKTASAKAVGCHECGRVTTWCHGGLARTDVRPCTHRTFRLAKAAPQCRARVRTAASHDHGVACAPRMDQARSGAQGDLAQVERGPQHPPVHAQCEISLQNQGARGRGTPRLPTADGGPVCAPSRACPEH
jgi:hypothetical protein